MSEIEILQQRVELLENFMADFVYSDRYISQKHFQFIDGKNIQLANGTGTKIGTEATQKLAFYGATPVARASSIASPSGGTVIDSQARSAIDLLRTAIQNIGITQ